jgi:hypothetical protein
MGEEMEGREEVAGRKCGEGSRRRVGEGGAKNSREKTQQRLSQLRRLLLQFLCAIRGWMREEVLRSGSWCSNFEPWDALPSRNARSQDTYQQQQHSCLNLERLDGASENTMAGLQHVNDIQMKPDNIITSNTSSLTRWIWQHHGTNTQLLFTSKCKATDLSPSGIGGRRGKITLRQQT